MRVDLDIAALHHARAQPLRERSFDLAACGPEHVVKRPRTLAFPADALVVAGGHLRALAQDDAHAGALQAGLQHRVLCGSGAKTRTAVHERDLFCASLGSLARQLHARLHTL